MGYSIRGHYSGVTDDHPPAKKVRDVKLEGAQGLNPQRATREQCQSAIYLIVTISRIRAYRLT